MEGSPSIAAGDNDNMDAGQRGSRWLHSEAPEQGKLDFCPCLVKAPEWEPVPLRHWAGRATGLQHFLMSHPACSGYLPGTRTEPYLHHHMLYSKKEGGKAKPWGPFPTCGSNIKQTWVSLQEKRDLNSGCKPSRKVRVGEFFGLAAKPGVSPALEGFYWNPQQSRQKPTCSRPGSDCP